MYVVLTYKGPGGHPLWKHVEWPLWVYKGIDGLWYVGDEAERGMMFGFAQGYLRSRNKSLTQWERFEEDSWVPVDTTVSDQQVMSPTTSVRQRLGLLTVKPKAGVAGSESDH